MASLKSSVTGSPKLFEHHMHISINAFLHNHKILSYHSAVLRCVVLIIKNHNIAHVCTCKCKTVMHLTM